jgi:hypothetical protein
MSTTTPPKPSVPVPPPTSTAFGVSIAATTQKAAEKAPMSRNQKALCWLGGVAVATALVLYFQFRPSGDPDPDVADHPGVKEVASLVEKKDVGALAQYVKNDDVVVARRAVEGLGRLGGVDALQESLADDRSEVRAAAISELGDRATVIQLPVLSQYLQDPAPVVRISAMRGVASIRDFSMFDFLVPMLADPDPSVRKGAISAIEVKMGQRFSGYNPSEPNTAPATIARVRAALQGFKKTFDNVNEIEANRKK